MRFRLLLILLLLPAALRAQTNPAPLKVALVSTCGGEAAGDATAIAEAQLGAEPGVILVERGEIRRVLEEQHLWRCGMSDTRQALAVGRLLDVDLFAAVEAFSSTNDAPGIVVFDARTGVRLWDGVLPAGDAVKAGAETAEAVRGAIAKHWGLAADGVRTVCLLSTRNVNLPREMDGRCEVVGRLLERGLIGSPSLTLLERQRLDQINNERSLPGHAGTNRLAAAWTLIEVEVSRAGAGQQLHGTAYLTDAAGKTLGKAEADAAEPDMAALAEALLPRVLAALSALSPAQPMDRKGEAKRFYNESLFLFNNGDPAGALKTAEAAAALDSGDIQIQLRLARSLAARANEMSPKAEQTPSEHFKAALPFAERALDICRSYRNRADEESWKQSRNLEAVEEMLGMTGKNRGPAFWQNALWLYAKTDQETKGRLLSYQKQLRSLLVEELWLRRSKATNAGGIYFLQSDFRVAVETSEWYAPTSAEWVGLLDELISGWLAVADKEYIPWGGWENSGNRMFAFLCAHAGGFAGEMTVINRPVPRIDGWQLRPADLERLDGLFSRMQRHRDPMVQAYGEMGKMALALRGQKEISEPMMQRYLAAKASARKEIATPGREPADLYRRHFYSVARDLIDLLPDAGYRQKEHLELFEWMLQRREVSYWTVMMACNPDKAARFGQYRWYAAPFPIEPVPFPPETLPVALANAVRVLDLFGATNREDVDATDYSFQLGRFDREVGAVCRHIIALQPGLATNLPVSSVSWDRVEVLMTTAAATNGGYFRKAALAGSNVLSLVQCMSAPARTECYRIPLDGRPPVLLATLPYDFSILWAGSPAPVVENGMVYMRVENDGVWTFPFDGGAVQKINRQTGLPSSRVGAFTVAEGRLYAMLSEGHLVSFDLKTRQCETLASSRAREKKSPLDASETGIEVLGMLNDEGRHRVLISTRFNERKNCHAHIGLWEVDTRTGKLKQLLQTHYPITWMKLQPGDQLLLNCPRNENDTPCGGPYDSAISYDLRSGAARLLWSFNEIRAAGPTLRGDAQTIRCKLTTSPPFLIEKDSLWMNSGGLVRLSTTSGAIEDVPSPVPSGCRILDRLNGENEFLLGNDRNLWRATLVEKKSKDSRP